MVRIAGFAWDVTPDPTSLFVQQAVRLTHNVHLLTDVPPQPNSPPDNVFHLDRRAKAALKLEAGPEARLQLME